MKTKSNLIQLKVIQEFSKTVTELQEIPIDGILQLEKKYIKLTNKSTGSNIFNKLSKTEQFFFDNLETLIWSINQYLILKHVQYKN